MLLCLSLVVFVHGFSQDQLLCLFCLSFVLFVHGFSRRTNSYASLFISCCGLFMVFLTEATHMLLCLSLVVFVHGFSHRSNSYASLFILYFVHGFSLLGTDHTNCGRQWIDTFHKKHCFSFLQQERMMSS
jgi:uncharacterized membrane protein YccC